MNTQAKQAQTDAMARAKAIQDQAIKDTEQRIKLFQAEQGFRKKSVDEELETARENQRLAIEAIDEKLKYERLTQSEYNIELLNINNDFLQKQTELVIDNAERERQLLLKELDKRENDYEEFSETRLEIERQNAQDRLEIEREFFDLQLDNGLINQQEYDDALAEAKEEAREAEQEAVNIFNEANLESQLIDLENERILEEQKFTDKFELQKSRLELQRLAEIEAAEKTGADIALINEKYAKFDEDIEKKKQENKQQLASQTFGMIADLLGKESALGKAAAVAQAIINTAQGVTKALAEGGLLGIATGALVGVVGAVNIAKIISTKPPKAEKGMKVPDKGTKLKGRSHRQGGIHIEAEGGEAIINKRSTSMFSGLLSAINVAGGGIPLAARGMIAGGTASSNANIQNKILEGA